MLQVKEVAGTRHFVLHWDDGGSGFVAYVTGLLLLCWLQLKAPGFSPHVLSSSTHQCRPNPSPKAATPAILFMASAPISNMLSIHCSSSLKKRKPKPQNCPKGEQDRLEPRLWSQTGSKSPLPNLVHYSPAE